MILSSLLPSGLLINLPRKRLPKVRRKTRRSRRRRKIRRSRRRRKTRNLRARRKRRTEIKVAALRNYLKL